ncbi:MAG TPA: N-acetylmuramoyl-L-alanine amidase, partial [Thermoanaerobaculia bacterium]|nr:N-acetylmuramoyl-L-alanine amidase [Thermoanaerobaculia bacterium]
DEGEEADAPALTAAPAELRAAPAITPSSLGRRAEAAGRYALTYSKDARGEVAIYRLRPGEALYSSVVVRFTGRLLAADVNALAEEIAERSGIRDVTDIPIGYRVKIPFELLMPEYLPPGHPKRRQWEEQLAESEQFDNPVEAAGLEGVTILLDAGHGGRDVGATFNGVWESVHVYDIMLRVRRLLLERTSARVIYTTQDGERLTPEDRDVLSYSRGHKVLTSPPYAIEEAPIGTNLRWYLANSLYHREVDHGVDPDKLVFLSIHADSLHPSLRGAMVYIPDAQLREGTFSKSGPIFEARREYQEQPQVSFSWASRLKSEGLSRDLAGRVISALGRHDVLVHPEKPVRERIIRRRSQYVP